MLRCRSRWELLRTGPLRYGATVDCTGNHLVDVEEWKHSMFANLNFWAILFALLCLGVLSTTDTASAVSVQLARKCDVLTAKAFPPRVVGNPAAGSTKGTGRDAQAYFRKCVTNNGKVDDQEK